MTMNYRPRNDRKKKRIFWLSGFLILAVLLIYFFSNPIKNLLSGTLNFTAYPFWKAQVSAVEKSFYLKSFLNSRIKQAEELRLAKEELLKIELKLKEFAILEEENRNLKTLLGREDFEETISALVLVRPPEVFYDVFVIDLGARDGISGGEKVFFENILLGYVEKVFSKTSQVKLLSSSGVETSAFIERINLPVNVFGRGGGNFEATVPQDVQVEIGDFLVIPGLPQKLLGQVEELEQRPAGAFKRILFKFPVNISEIRWVALEKI